VVNVLLLPSDAVAEIITDPATVTKDFGDDTHTSTVLALTAITGANGNKENQSGGLINVGDAAFAAKNDSGEKWTFNWAPEATQKAVEGTMSGTYYAWVVSAPTNVKAGGGNYNDPKDDGFIERFGKDNMNEVGGALLNITANYAVPADTATDKYSLHWVQALTGSYSGVPRPTGLDNPFAEGKAPFYDAGGAAGTVAGNPNAWFLDIPNAFENENETNPVASITFQLVLALDDQKKADKSHTVTLLGGYQWGYTYTAVETPEPSTLTLLGTGAFGLIGCAWRRRKRTAA
jgi:hypothetical protein